MRKAFMHQHITNCTGTPWSKKQSRNMLEVRNPWFGVPVGLFLSQTALNSSVSLTETPSLEKPRLWRSPDRGGREEEGAQRGSEQSGHRPRCIQPRRLHRKASSQPRTARFPPGTDSPSLLKVARAAGRIKTQRQQLSQSAGMAGPARRPPLQGSLPGAWRPLVVLLPLHSAVPSLSSIRWFYRLFYLTQS